MTAHRFAALAICLALAAAPAPATESGDDRDPNSPAPGADTSRETDSPPPEPAPRRARNVALDEPVGNTPEDEEQAPKQPEQPEQPEQRDGKAEPAPPAGEETASGSSEREGDDQPASRDGAQTPADPESPDAGAEPPPAEEAPPEQEAAEQEKENKEEREEKEEKEQGEDPVLPLVLLGAEVPPATSTRLAWAPSQSFEGIYSPTPVLVVNGAEPGPTLCLTAAVHGDELNGVETVRRVLYNLDAEKLRGAVIGVPIVNLQGFHRGSRYLTDRRDLNRYFPGDPGGSSASRIAHSFFHEVIKHCSAVVDLHTGSFYRSNLPQLRGDLRNSQVVRLTESFGSTVVLHSEGAEGTLRRAAVEAGIPAVTLEAGAPMVLTEEHVSHSVKGVRTLLNHLDMVSKFRLWGDPEPVYYNSTWQRAPEGGIVFSKVSLGQDVREGDLLGTVTNPITNVRTEIHSSYDGRVLGMAMNQVVQPGFATHHIGIETPREQISESEDVPAEPPAGDEGGGEKGPENSGEQERPQHDSAEDEDFEADPGPANGREDDMAAPEE